MNYRHAFHAGNFADATKHALLVWLVRALARKDTPFRVLDTHAGTGGYDLGASEAARTGEWRQGIGRLSGIFDGPLADYVAQAGAEGFYPGSPMLVRPLLRPADRLVCCELHPEDCPTLRARFRGDPQVAVHHRDGWEALRALTPFPERRGLVLVDPPFEEGDDFARIAAAVRLLHQRFRGVVQAYWYPIKHRAPVRALHDDLRAARVPDILAAELWLREPTDPQRLNGCGLLVVNAPWRFEDEGGAILAALLAALGDREAGEGWAIRRIADE